MGPWRSTSSAFPPALGGVKNAPAIPDGLKGIDGGAEGE